MKRTKIIISIISVLLFSLFSGADTYAGENDNYSDTENPYVAQVNEPVMEEKDDETYIENPYFTVSFLDLYAEGGLEAGEMINGQNIYQGPEGGIFVEAEKEHLNESRIRINKKFNFDGNAVGRCTFNGMAQSGYKVIVNIYVDDEVEPIASFPLMNVSDESNWFVISNPTKDVYSRRLTGEHNISLGFEVTEIDGQGSVDIVDELGEEIGDISGEEIEDIPGEEIEDISGVEIEDIPGEEIEDIPVEESDQVRILIYDIEFAQSSLPVVYFDIDETQGTIEQMNSSENHSEKCYGKLTIQVPDGYIGEYDNLDYTGNTDYQDLALEYIRGRGNSTWMVDKKPYKFKLDKKKDLFGMGKSKHWVLLANYYDNSLSRNRMTYWLINNLNMEYSPQCVPVEVVMNDQYYGTYLLSEQVRVEKSRVDIDELDDTITEEPDLSGGYLFSMSPKAEDPEESIFYTTNGMSFVNGTPDFYEEGNEAQKEYIRNYVQKTENAIYGQDFKDENGISYKEYVDFESMVDYMLIQEFSMNGDAYGTPSTYLYKKRNGKLFWGPLWDFDYVAWGNLDYEYHNVDNINFCSCPWVERLKCDATFIDQTKDSWINKLKPKMEYIIEDGGLLDNYYEEQKIAEAYNYNKWGRHASETTDYIQEIDNLKEFISLRIDYMSSALESDDFDFFYTANFYVMDELYFQKKYLYKAFSGDFPPQEPYVEGYRFQGWITQDGERFEPSYYEGENQVNVYAEFLDIETAIRGEDIFFEKYKYSVNLDYQTELAVDYEIYPYTYEYDEITWKSSDENIASIDQDGVITFYATGDVVINGTLSNGASKSMYIHIYSDLGENMEAYVSGENSARYVNTISADDMKLVVGEYDQIIVNSIPEYAHSVYSFMVEDDSIATVDDYGLINAISPGETEIVISEIYTDLEIRIKLKVSDIIIEESHASEGDDIVLAKEKQDNIANNKDDSASNKDNSASLINDKKKSDGTLSDKEKSASLINDKEKSDGTFNTKVNQLKDNNNALDNISKNETYNESKIGQDNISNKDYSQDSVEQESTSKAANAPNASNNRTAKPTDTSKTTTVNTGDKTPVIPLIILMVAAIIYIIIYIRFTKRV